MVDFPTVFAYLKSIRFNGPVNIHYEHHGLLGTDVGRWTLDMPRREFVNLVKHDLEQIRAHTQ
jgi:hypothetical protein